MTSLPITHRTSTAALHAIFMAPGAPLANWVVLAAHISAPLQVALTNAHILSMSSDKVSQTDIDALVTALRHEANPKIYSPPPARPPRRAQPPSSPYRHASLVRTSTTNTLPRPSTCSHPSIRSAHGHVSGCSEVPGEDVGCFGVEAITNLQVHALTLRPQGTDISIHNTQGLTRVGALPQRPLKDPTSQRGNHL